MERQIEVFSRRRSPSIQVRGLKTHYYFRVVGDNGEIIAQSEGYTAKHNILELIGKYFPEWKVTDLSVT